MADETTLTPVEGAEPPKANPLAKPASSNSSTLTLKPLAHPATGTASGLKLPPKPGLATAGLKLPPKAGLATAGLKLPPKPGALTQTGLKLPPKPGALTQTGLKLPPKPGALTQTGLKLPPKPGALTQTGLKLPPKPGAPTQTGLKLPPKPAVPTATQTGVKQPSKAGLATAGLNLPTRPVIRKPGATGSTQSLLRPTLSGLKKPTLAGVTKPATVAASAATVVKPAAPTVVKPVTSTAATVAPTVAKPAAAAPAAEAPVAELTPVTPTEVRTVPAAEVKPNQTAALDALKDATQNLKSVTAPIPQQAILRKTGMLAEEKSEGQKQAAKSKTSRISLSEAMGAAPVQNENAPMKTIRIKRPIDIPGVTKPAGADAPTEAKTVPAARSATEATTATATGSAPAGEGPAVTLTQRKTLKISRPSGGVMRPSGKFGIKRPGTMVTSKTAASKEGTTAADSTVVKTPAAPGGDVPEIADIPALPTAAAPKPVVAGEKDLPKGVSILGIIIQTAACATMGALAWWLYTDTQILPF